MYIPTGPAERPKRHVPLQDYLRDLVRYPARTLSDIALDRPLVRGGGLLLGALALAGAALGGTGLPGLGRGLSGAAGGGLAVPAVGVVGFLLASVVLHRMGKSLEGWGSYAEMVSALTFALLPLGLLAPAALLRLAPGGWGGFLFFLASAGITGWTLRLIYLGVRESHRFTGTQAILTLMVPVTLAALIGFVGALVLAMVALGLGIGG